MSERRTPNVYNDVLFKMISPTGFSLTDGPTYDVDIKNQLSYFYSKSAEFFIKLA